MPFLQPQCEIILISHNDCLIAIVCSAENTKWFLQAWQAGCV